MILTPSKQKALTALLTHKTKVDAARAVGIDPKTLRRYFDDPDFQEAYKKAFGSLVEDAAREAQQAISPALSTLREIVEDRDEQAPARVQACRAILESAMKLTERIDVLSRLTELEKTVCEMEDRQ